MTSTRITVPIRGGREDGYRLYSMKYNVFAGDWRVNVETLDGRVIGRVNFKIVDSDTPATTTVSYK